MDLIAIRTYPIDSAEDDLAYTAQDFLHRKDDGEFMLRKTSNTPCQSGNGDFKIDFEGWLRWLRESARVPVMRTRLTQGCSSSHRTATDCNRAAASSATSPSYRFWLAVIR
jgi:hypothetical protein